MTRLEKLKEIVDYANMLIQDDRESARYLLERLYEYSILVERARYDNRATLVEKIFEFRIADKKIVGLDKFINSIIKEKKEYEKNRIARKLSKINCPICGKELIRLEPYVKGKYEFWCDDCILETTIIDSNTYQGFNQDSED